MERRFYDEDEIPCLDEGQVLAMSALSFLAVMAVGTFIFMLARMV